MGDKGGNRGACKRIALAHAFNCRDLGGYPCKDGRAVAFRKLIRCDNPSALTGEEWRVLYDYGVRCVIDLRSSVEANMSPYKPDEEIERIAFPLQNEDEQIRALQGKSADEIDPDELARSVGKAFGKSLLDGYEQTLENSKERVAAVLNLIGERVERGAVLFHCTAGKDRTGVVAALLYLLCGVGEADIIADYQVTETYLAASGMLSKVPERYRPLLCSNPDTMRRFLESARTRDYFGLLRKHGLSEEAVRSIRRCATEAW